MIGSKLKRYENKCRIFFKVWKKTLVLMYHRVEEVSIDPWNLSVSPENFEGHLKILKKTGLVRPINQLKENYFSKEELKPAIVITFDDGYLDNYLNAKPLLEKYNLPATFFITHKHLGEKKEFWWDELVHMILETPIVPREINLEIEGNHFYFDLKNEDILTEAKLKQNKAWDGLNEPPTLRTRLYFRLWEKLSPLMYGEQQATMEKLRMLLGIAPHRNTNNYCMSESQLLALASNDLFTIAGHTYSHPLLPAHDFDFQLEEIGSNKKYLENLTNQKINSFAYPSGKTNVDTEKALQNLGFDFAVITRKKRVQKEDSQFQIGRYQINNWKKNEFKQRLGYWLI